MDTRMLFYEDAFLRSCTSAVRECSAAGDRFEIELDQTCFYPEGGGQPGDTGMLGDVPVFDTQLRGGRILHYTRSPLTPGTEVTAAVDWDRRFDLMQQHSGEHMVSGVIHRLWGYENMGFHMGADRTTIDLSGPLTWEQLLDVEAEVDRLIWRNDPVRIWYPSPDELAGIPYRSKKELTGDIRIVEFPGADICACCGLHVTRTGEIGMVKILSVVHFREGVRVEMIAGERVLQKLQMLQEQNRRISAALSAKPEETADAVDRVQEENYRLRGQLHKMESDLFAAEAARHEGEGSVLLFREEMEADSIRKLCDAVMKTCHGCCAVFSQNPDGSYKYAMGEENGDLRSFTKEMNAALNGRGGGKPFFVQGSVKAAEEEIRKFFAR